MTEATRNLLEQHFDTAFAAPDGIAKLRELILTLAMRGKLVEQNPNDPSASELLKEIDAEKHWLVKTGKIKKPNSLLPIKPDEVPYELPQGWEWVRLGDLIYLEMGQSPSSAFYNQENDGLAFFQGKADFGTLHPTPRYWCTNPQKYAFPEDVLLSVRAPVGPTNIANIECCIGRGLAALRPLAGVGAKFINYLMIRFRFALEEKATGTTFAAVSKTDVENLLIPAIPLPEQQCIVARIDQLMARCDELEKLRKEREEKRLAVHAAAIKQLLDAPDDSAWDFIQQHFGELYTVKENVAELRKVILQLAVMGRLVRQDPNDPPVSKLLKEIEAEKLRLVKAGKIKKLKPLSPIELEELPYELPKGWEWVRFGDLTTEIATGPFGSMIHKSDYVLGGIPLINPSHMIDGKIVHDPSISVSHVMAKKLNSYKLFVNDIVMARRGEMGRCAIVTTESDGFLCGTGSFVLRFIDKINRQYILNLFKTEYAREYLGGNSVGTTMTNLNHGILNNMPVLLPPLPEQHRIVARIDQLMALCDTLDQQINAATGKQTELLNAVMAQI